jgi:2,3,4,5-tetrahydropyridine-2-carboxylate N-succinyltransferase
MLVLLKRFLFKKINYICVKLSHMNPLQTIIEQAWENRALLQEETTTNAIRELLSYLTPEIVC